MNIRFLRRNFASVQWGLPARNSVPYYTKHTRALLAEVKSTVYEDLDAQAFLRILAEVSG